MSQQQGAMILSFLSGLCILIANSPVGAPIAPLLQLIAAAISLGLTSFFGNKVVQASARMQALKAKILKIRR